MTERRFYSIRSGRNPNCAGFDLPEFLELFIKLYGHMAKDGYFDENFGFYCVDSGEMPGKVADIEYEVLLKLRKKNIWPILKRYKSYSEDDIFDVIELLFEYVSKPIDGTYHSWNDCGMHWETFNKTEGQKEYHQKVNELLALYNRPFVLSTAGEILARPEKGFEKIFESDIPSKDCNVVSRIDAAVIKFRKHGASLEDRRLAVRDLADVLEYLRPKLQALLTKKDENDLFTIANNFGIRHHNDKQKTNYDQSIWLSWMFYFYLSTIHVALRKMGEISS